MEEQRSLYIFLCDFWYCLHLLKHTIHTSCYYSIQTSSQISRLHYPNIVLSVSLSLVVLA